MKTPRLLNHSIVPTLALGVGAFLMAVLPAAFGSEGHGPTLHPGFENGVLLGSGVVQSSLAAEDIDEDGIPELVVGGNEGILYAFKGDGTPVLDQNVGKGFPNPAAIGQLFAPGDGAPILSTPTLADVDSDRRMDIFFGNDAGKVYHLRVILSTDDFDKKWAPLAPAKAAADLPRDRKAVDPEEGDDSRGR